MGADGETHHGCFDALFLSEIPGFTVFAPPACRAAARCSGRHCLK
ncbi:MAG: hypothetical protein V8R40_07315 [Dysosmobacter sp.]